MYEELTDGELRVILDQLVEDQKLDNNPDTVIMLGAICKKINTMLVVNKPPPVNENTVELRTVEQIKAEHDRLLYEVLPDIAPHSDEVIGVKEAIETLEWVLGQR